MMTLCRAFAGRALFPLLLLIVAWAGAAQAPSTFGQAPSTSSGQAPVIPAPPPPEPSTITVPIRSSLSSLSPDIESRVESHYSGKASERGIDVDYDVDRDPIRLSMVGAGLHSSTTVHYALQACRGRFPCISCGFDESRRVADIKLHTKLDWDPSWRLRSTTKLLPVDYAKPCQVTWLDIDITGRFVAPVIERQLNAAARIIDRNVPALTNVKPQAQQIWNALQMPYELAPRTWLVLEPTAAALTPITGAKDVITTTLILRAQTRVVIGESPVLVPRPLPNLSPVAPGTPAAGIRVPFDLDLPYEEASRLASRDYAGKTYQISGKTLKVESIRLAPAPNGRVLIEALIDYRGGRLRNYRGLAFLEGTPRFDAATSSIVVPDLDYSLDPKRRGLLARIAERAAHDTIRTRLRESARFAIGARIAEVRAEITRALNRQLAPGVLLRGRADTIEPKAVTPLATVISVRVIATGQAEVELRR